MKNVKLKAALLIFTIFTFFWGLLNHMITFGIAWGQPPRFDSMFLAIILYIYAGGFFISFIVVILIDFIKR